MGIRRFRQYPEHIGVCSSHRDDTVVIAMTVFSQNDEGVYSDAPELREVEISTLDAIRLVRDLCAHLKLSVTDFVIEQDASNRPEAG